MNLRNIVLCLSSIIFIFVFFTFTIKDKFNFFDRVEFLGLNIVDKTELKQAILDLELKEKNFWQIDSKKISDYLAKRPLIKQVKIRTIILPKPHYKLFVLEERPWAIYREAIYNEDAKLIVDSPATAKLFKSQSVESLYKSPSLLKISSYTLLPEEEMLKIYKLVKLISGYLSFINQAEIVLDVNLDSEMNLILKTKNYQIFLGAMDAGIFDRAKKMEQIVNSVKKLGQDLSYIDLSLSTDEVILGKKRSYNS